jgi:hypothetical protein
VSTSRSLSTVLTVFAVLIFLSTQLALAQEPVSVMIVANFHMSNPGHDLHNVDAGDVLLPDRQVEIGAVATALNTFHPTKIMAEWRADLASERYSQYLAGTLAPSRNEVVQLGFRLARKTGLSHFYGIDVDGEFPYDAVENFAKAHGKTGLLERANREIEASTQAQTNLLRTRGVVATLRYLNDPSRLDHDNSFYRQMLFVGTDSQQPGSELLTAWYRRNLLICANILQNSEPGDRVVVFYGSGHAFLLRQCVTETPGFILVEPNSFLPN